VTALWPSWRGSYLESGSLQEWSVPTQLPARLHEMVRDWVTWGYRKGKSCPLWVRWLAQTKPQGDKSWWVSQKGKLAQGLGGQWVSAWCWWRGVAGFYSLGREQEWEGLEKGNAVTKLSSRAMMSAMWGSNAQRWEGDRGHEKEGTKTGNIGKE
jgi:hypothetical protein